MLHARRGSRAPDIMETVNRYRAVLFDLDDTLLDRDRAVEAYARRLHAELGLGCPERAFVDEFLALDDHGYGDKRAMMSSLINSYKLKRSAESIMEHWAKRAWIDLSCNDGALELLGELKARGCLSGIVTNGTSAFQRAKIAGLGIEGRLGVIAISEEVGFAKPRREIFAWAANALGVSPERCVFVGDNLEKDVVGSAQAGMKGILYDKFGRQAEAPFPRIGNLNKVLELL
jgi:putative hydrolase of the HAD superfamily